MSSVCANEQGNDHIPFRRLFHSMLTYSPTFFPAIVKSIGGAEESRRVGSDATIDRTKPRDSMAFRGSCAKIDALAHSGIVRRLRLAAFTRHN